MIEVSPFVWYPGMGLFGSMEKSCRKFVGTEHEMAYSQCSRTVLLPERDAYIQR